MAMTNSLVDLAQGFRSPVFLFIERWLFYSRLFTFSLEGRRDYLPASPLFPRIRAPELLQLR